MPPMSNVNSNQCFNNVTSSTSRKHTILRNFCSINTKPLTWNASSHVTESRSTLALQVFARSTFQHSFRTFVQHISISMLFSLDRRRKAVTSVNVQYRDQARFSRLSFFTFLTRISNAFTTYRTTTRSSSIVPSFNLFFVMLIRSSGIITIRTFSKQSRKTKPNNSSRNLQFFFDYMDQHCFYVRTSFSANLTNRPFVNLSRFMRFPFRKSNLFTLRSTTSFTFFFARSSLVTTTNYHVNHMRTTQTNTSSRSFLFRKYQLSFHSIRFPTSRKVSNTATYDHYYPFHRANRATRTISSIYIPTFRSLLQHFKVNRRLPNRMSGINFSQDSSIFRRNQINRTTSDNCKLTSVFLSFDDRVSVTTINFRRKEVNSTGNFLVHANQCVSSVNVNFSNLNGLSTFFRTMSTFHGFDATRTGFSKRGKTSHNTSQLRSFSNRTSTIFRKTTMKITTIVRRK